MKVEIELIVLLERLGTPSCLPQMRTFRPTMVPRLCQHLNPKDLPGRLGTIIHDYPNSQMRMGRLLVQSPLVLRVARSERLLLARHVWEFFHFFALHLIHATFSGRRSP
jgi:hypothetical protein